MYCKNCGKQIENSVSELCSDCESLLNTTVVSGNDDFKVVEEVENNNYSSNNYTNNSNQNYTQTTTTVNSSNNKPKSKVAAGLFGIFLGAFGIHNFYLGYNSKAVAQLLITLLSCGVLSFVSAIWGFIEGILILVGNISKDADGVDLVD